MPACSAFGCTNRPSKNIPGVTFHLFPKEEHRRALWINAVGRYNWIPSHCSVLCSKHFPEDLIDRTSVTTVRLRKHAVPSIFKAFPAYLKKRRYCCVPNCHPSKKEQKISYHEIPADPNRRLLWLKAISRQGSSKDSTWLPGQHSVVCQRHFKDDDYSQCNNRYYIENNIRRLKPSAVPSLFLPKSSPGKTEETYLKSNASIRMPEQQENRNLDYISCSVPGCQSKSHRKVEHNVAEKNILMFPLPRNVEVINKWKEVFKGTNIELTTANHFCERHFLENDIVRCYRKKTPQGDIIKFKKKIPTLKAHAVPVKFLKPYSGRNLTERSLTHNSCDSKSGVIDRECDISDALPVNSKEEQVSYKKKYLSYSELIENIQLVKKPSKSWSVVCIDEFTIFAKWNNKFIAEKRLVIENSLTVRVFFKDWEIEMTDLVDLTSVDDVSLLLEKVENYNMDSA